MVGALLLWLPHWQCSCSSHNGDLVGETNSSFPPPGTCPANLLPTDSHPSSNKRSISSIFDAFAILFYQNLILPLLQAMRRKRVWSGRPSSRCSRGVWWSRGRGSRLARCSRSTRSWVWRRRASLWGTSPPLAVTLALRMWSRRYVTGGRDI